MFGSQWTGLYVGVHDGGAWGSSSWGYPDGTHTAPGFDTGAVFGGQAGYLYQWYNVVAGVEVSYSGLPNVDARAWCPGYAGVCENDLGGLLLVNGRLGYAFDRFLVYGTGGYARSKLSVATDFSDPGINLRDEGAASGWNAGGGIEFLVLPNVVVGVEYVHVDLNDADFAMTNTTGTLAQAVNVDAEFDIVRARFSVKLDRDREPPQRLK